METRIACGRSLSRLLCDQLRVLLLLGQFVSLAYAEASPQPDLPPMTQEQAQLALKRLEQRVAAADTASEQQLKELQKEIARVRSTAQNCVQAQGPGIELLDSQLAVLLPKDSQGTQSTSTQSSQPTRQAASPSSPAIARQLRDLQDRKASLQDTLASCKLMLLSSNELDSHVDAYLNGLFARQLRTRGPTLASLVRSNLDEGEGWKNFGSRFAARVMRRDAISSLHVAGAAVAALLGFVLGHFLPRRLRAWTASVQGDRDGVSAGLVQAFVASSASYAPVLCALGSCLAYLIFLASADSDTQFAVTLLFGLLAYFAIAAVIRALLNPCPPATPYLPLPEAIALPLSRRLRFLAVVMLLRFPMLELHEQGLLNDTMFALARQILGWVWVLNVIWAVWLLRKLEGWGDRWALLLLLSLAVFSGGLAAGFGYLNLGMLVIVGVAYTLLLLGVTLVLIQFFSDLFDGLDEGHYGWQRTVRRVIGLKAGEYVPGLGWIRLAVNLVIWIGAGLLLLHIWDANENVTSDIFRYFTQGFQVGSVTIVPSHLLYAIFVFAIMLTLTGWLKDKLNTRWLVKARMEPSAREALVTAFGYLAAAVAFIVALLFAGFDFASLAIIAGALSVGLGFGLQNIVNNFVSGVIMLVERPVRIGDWIVVGDAEGTIQSISIRSTTIRTFDQADVIVPNSELISGQVTNWTLGNTRGRIKVQIGVAYGSDVETVINTLIEVARNNSEVISGSHLQPDPYVLFLAFGDSSLNFELRAIIRNVNNRMHVISDINREINAAFNKLGIEIPFPQRDINFRGPLHTGRDPGATPGASDG
ncbi:MAG: mechanosensitive ion channel family protein [Pseudomonadales bacterium]|nr:mechanosensitive ion channel family protein [Halioglobus sp.]MCP5128852.1 mechanosensitive ion channel family protein [Pseudomonadales bacterium]